MVLQRNSNAKERPATMYDHRKGLSLFQLIDRKKFDALAQKWEIDKRVRTFDTWEMTQALLCCFVMRLESYREVEASLGIPDATFGDALRTRFSGFFRELCELILMEIRSRTPNRKVKGAIRELLAIDSSEIRVHGRLKGKAGRWEPHYTSGDKASAHLHIVWNVEGEWIDDFRVSPCRSSDSRVGHDFKLKNGKMYVFDRAYSDFDFWEKIVAHGSHFVTRVKQYKRHRDLEFEILKKSKNIDGVLYDEPYQSTSASARNSSLKLRYVIYRDPITKRVFHFMSSDQKVSAQTIASIYKKRWSVELLFRWLKGHLNIRYLSVRTKNAVRTQLAVAVLIQLLIQLKKIAENYRGSLWMLLCGIRMNLLRKIVAESGPPEGVRWRTPIQADLRSGTQ
jgi:hypothetical protein